MKDLSRRTADFTDSVIRRMTRISNRYGAVNLSQGFPDFDPPKALLDRLAQVSYEDFHQYSITGWRLGYTIAPEEITERIKKVHDFLTVGAAAPLQEAVIPGLRFGQDYYDQLQATYTRKRDLFLRGLDDLKLAHTDPQGAYYVLLDISEFGYDSDLTFCEDLAREVGVGAVPGSSFFHEPVNHLIRLHFAKKEDTLLQALNRLGDLRKKLGK